MSTSNASSGSWSKRPVEFRTKREVSGGLDGRSRSAADSVVRIHRWGHRFATERRLDSGSRIADSPRAELRHERWIAPREERALVIEIAPNTEPLAKIDAAKEHNIRFVELQFTDILGIVKGVTIPLHQLEGSLKNGTWFDGSSIEGFTRIAESDQWLAPDMDTFAEIPWQPGHGDLGAGPLGSRGTARVICDVMTPDGQPFVGDPRGVLKRQRKRTLDLGYIWNAGAELEFFLFRKDADGNIRPLPHDTGGYFDFNTDLAQAVRRDMVNALEAFGIRVEAAHHEVAYGQHEIDFQYADGLKTADNAVTFKFTLKAIANLHGLYATFMPKPIFRINGYGMHTHQNLFSNELGRNAFADPDNQYGLSDLARSYMAGILAHARGMI